MPSNTDLGGAETLSLEGVVVPAASAVGPLAAAWDRYELLEILGKGGMGSVYKARDHRLDRTIAVKFILGADPNLTMRFLREARAQARIDHPNVCRIYEVGEVQGRAYIAIQFVDGEPLHKAAAGMSLDEKIAVVRDVAVAVHEAHRLGIVHRDLKPANVMIQRAEDGRWFPIVMDFGLAREATVQAGITVSGAVLGTPAYMSPEQARGDVHAIDRRSDVYSLGATLYELLTGCPPFSATSLAELLATVIHADPPAPRSLVPSLPIDLEIIALKCLAKDPKRRYLSARALADDLGCYLDGEPILGRRPPLWQRFRLRVRTWRKRKRMVVLFFACALVLELAIMSLGVSVLISRSEHARTAERTVLAGRLGQDAKEIELFLHSAYQLPLHDTRPDREIIRKRMRTIAATHRDLGELGDAVVHEALGHGYLALHQWREAADELAHAADAGLQTPELHAARGRALGELYHRALEDARRSGDKAWLAGRQHELAQQYLRPALAELDKAGTSGESAVLLEAMVALYRGEFAVAEQRALGAAEHAPWLFEARKLAADAAYGAAVELFDHGRYDAALPGLERAATQYAQASEIARSDASVYEAGAQAWLQRGEIDIRQGRSGREPLDHALQLVDRAVLVDPESGPAYMTKSYVLLRQYQTRSQASLDDQRLLLVAIAQAAAHAVEIDPRDARAWDALGNAHVARGIHETTRGGQGVPWWSHALEEFGKALAIQPNDPWANNDLGTAHRWLGTSLDKTGGDPIPAYSAALRSYERATAIDPQYVYAWFNQADIHESIAEHDDAIGLDPGPAVDHARRAGERGLAVDPSFSAALDKMAQAYLLLADHLIETGGDPTETLVLVRSYLDRVDRLEPGDMLTWFYRLIAARSEARFRLREGADPTSALAMGRTALKEVLRLLPGSAYVYIEAARLDLVDAAWAARAGRRSAPLLAAARTNAEKAITLDAQSADAKLTAAEAYLQIAMAERSPAIADRGIAYVDQALALNPRLIKGQATRAALLRLHAW